MAASKVIPLNPSAASFAYGENPRRDLPAFNSSCQLHQCVAPEPVSVSNLRTLEEFKDWNEENLVYLIETIAAFSEIVYSALVKSSKCVVVPLPIHPSRKAV